MADATVSSSAPGKRRRWLRLLACTLGILVAFVLVVYFVATSSAFFKGVILPRAGKALGAKITVSDASISPFRQVVLRNLKLQTTGPEPLVSAAEIRLRYSLLDILGGNLHVEEATLSSPTVVLAQNPDGSMNLDPILKALSQKPTPKEAKPAPAGKAAKPLQVDLKQLNLTGATLRYVKLYKNGNRDVDELSNVNLAVAGVKNGQAGKLTLQADISVRNNPPPPGTNALLEAKLNGSFDFALTADLKPGSVKGNTRLEVARAEGALAQAATLGADLDCDLTPAEIKQVALRFQKGGIALGQLRVSGPFDLGKTEGRLNVEIAGIDKQLLNLAGAAGGVGALSGLDFGTTAVSATNQVQLAKSGSVITAGGQFNLNKLQVTRAGQTTPTLDLRAAYDATVDRSQNTALLRGLTMTGTQQGNPLLRAELTSPMSLAWGNVTNALGDSALSLTLSGLNLADWQPFLGSLAPAGLVNGQVKLLSQQSNHASRYHAPTQRPGLQPETIQPAPGQAASLSAEPAPAHGHRLGRL
jgi:hypothetical protein